MSRSSKILLLGIVSILSGLLGFWFGYAANRKDVLEMFGTLAKAPEVRIADLAYAFAPSAQIVELIGREPRQPPEWAHTEEKVEFLRKLRLAVVADSPSKRSSLLAQAEATCGGCRAESIRRLFQRYAQSRLVPPGDDIVCDDCAPAQRRKALPRSE